MKDASASYPTDSTTADSTTSSLSAVSIAKWSAVTCTSPTIDSPSGTADIEPPPDGGYGWVCVLSCFLINAFSWGVVSSYGVYLAYYLSHPLFPTATPTTYALLGGLNFGTATLSAPLLTILTRRYGPGRLILLGAFLQTLSLILASFATETWHLHLTQGVLLGLAVGCAYIPSVAILPQWFEARRSIAAGIAAAGSGLGGVVFSFATQPLIDRFSLAWSLRAIAVISGSMLLVAALLLRTRNAAIQPKQHGFAIRLLARYEVVLLLGWSFASLVGYIVLLFSLSDFAQAIGMSPHRAADITGLVNVGTALGRPFVGALSDRWGRVEVAGVVTAVCGVISEVIALKLRTRGTAHPYIGPQVLAGTAYLVAAGIMLELWRVHRRKAGRAAAGVDVEEG
ncbi:hypothetical protein GMDG_05449 [Pseudogymnoascus destructans 20631-21]|uniref:Major facilitator superfamily (MFS) profile domain-containing protein n=1 Tax=Pseudogymnoascus destructans (strain ATCC MYA-4855 / 20631-21) TaxID=658429 RepID=L8FRP5_PSED2|nr:hypothetical protein GMDG_05449 [Pseudogymnoascus destructans 20631-21]